MGGKTSNKMQESLAPCHKIALSALLAIPGFLRTHSNNYQNSSESAHLIPKFTVVPDACGWRPHSKGLPWQVGGKIT
jgi:hypothetical protein